LRVAPHIGIILLLRYIDISRRGFKYERGKKLAKCHRMSVLYFYQGLDLHRQPGSDGFIGSDAGED
jgi:hypothetical protein